MGNFSDFLFLSSLSLAVATSDVEDVREVLHYYRQFDSPLDKFKDNLRKLQEIEQKEKEEKAKQPQAPVKKWSPGLFNRK